MPQTKPMNWLLIIFATFSTLACSFKLKHNPQAKTNHNQPLQQNHKLKLWAW